jgi:hypothetical protein
MVFFSKGKALAVVFMLVATTYVVLLVNAALVKKGEVESFEVSTAADSADSSSVDYDGRKQVITIFDSMFKRKPNPDEIEKYASFGSKKAILNAILADYDKLEVIGQAAAKEPKADPLPPAPSPTVDAFDQAQGTQAPVSAPASAVAQKVAAFEAAWAAIKAELPKN